MRVWRSVWRHSAGWLVCAERSISRVARPVFIRCRSLYRPVSRHSYLPRTVRSMTAVPTTMALRLAPRRPTPPPRSM